MNKLYQAYLNSNGISTDSRSLNSGQIFFALRGDNFDGHKFVQQAVAKGAIAIVVDHHLVGFDYTGSMEIFTVQNTLQALQKIALIHREKFEGICMALTGSNGKTTTKELINAILRKRFLLHATPGNFNNHIGLPLTILSMPQQTNFLLLEMGANHQGEIAELCGIGLPEYGLVTNVANAHLEGFGSLSGVIKAKGELYKHICNYGKVAFYDEESPYLFKMIPCDKGMSYDSIFKAHQLEIQIERTDKTNSGLVIEFVHQNQKTKCPTNLTGRYNFQNIRAAVATGLYFDIPVDSIIEALRNYQPNNMRSQVIRTGTNTIILDAYNANPSSMEAALENLEQFSSNKLAILGDMLELGAEAEAFHKAIIAKALAIENLRLITIGPLFGEVAQASDRHIHFENSADAGNWLRNEAPQNSTILFKGSRGIGVEKAFQMISGD